MCVCVPLQCWAWRRFYRSSSLLCSAGRSSRRGTKWRWWEWDRSAWPAPSAFCWGWDVLVVRLLIVTGCTRHSPTCSGLWDRSTNIFLDKILVDLLIVHKVMNTLLILMMSVSQWVIRPCLSTLDLSPLSN